MPSSLSSALSTYRAYSNWTKLKSWKSSQRLKRDKNAVFKIFFFF